MTYNGHRSKAAWNVALWINNDEGLYRLAVDCLRQTRDRDTAAAALLAALHERGITETPDGARYTKTTVRAALFGL